MEFYAFHRGYLPRPQQSRSLHSLRRKPQQQRAPAALQPPTKAASTGGAAVTQSLVSGLLIWIVQLANPQSIVGSATTGSGVSGADGARSFR